MAMTMPAPFARSPLPMNPVEGLDERLRVLVELHQVLARRRFPPSDRRVAVFLALENDTQGGRRKFRSDQANPGSIRAGASAPSTASAPGGWLLVFSSWVSLMLIVRPDSPRHHTPMTIKVGILQTGNPPPPLQERFGSYSAMVQELLGPQHEFATFEVRNGELPADAEELRRLCHHRLGFGCVRRRRLDRCAQRLRARRERAQRDGRHLLRSPVDGRGVRRPGDQVAARLGHRVASLRGAGARRMDGRCALDRSAGFAPGPGREIASRRARARRQRIHAVRDRRVSAAPGDVAAVASGVHARVRRGVDRVAAQLEVQRRAGGSGPRRRCASRTIARASAAGSQQFLRSNVRA